MENGTNKQDLTFDQIYDWSIKKAKTYCDQTILKQDYPVDGEYIFIFIYIQLV